MKGKVKWFHPEKGYGFIEDEEGRDVFAHYSYIQEEGFRQLDQGDFVTFDVVESEKGIQARNIVKIEE